MHRSGTSSVAGALVRLGGAAPHHLAPANPDNARGLWESTVVKALNDEILAVGGSAWTDWRRFDLIRVDPGELRALRRRAKAALLSEFGAGIPVIKDPRMCRLMRFWQPVFEDLGWAPRALLPIRSPLEVAWSLRRRDGLSLGRSCLLWLRHVFDAEAATRGLRRAALDWSSFLRDWPAALNPALDRLDVRFARSDSRGFAEVENFLSSELRRFTATDAELHADPAVSVLPREVYGAMLELANDGDSPVTLARIDALRARFEEAVAVFDSTMAEHERVEKALARANAVIACYAYGTAAKRPFERPWSRRGRVIRQELWVVRNSPFFDQAFYLGGNPDVGGDAALHYCLHGWREGRDPGPFFSTTDYLARNPDVRAAAMNPLVHYERHGRKEGRAAIGCSFRNVAAGASPEVGHGRGV